MTSPAGSRSRWSSGNVRVSVWVAALAGNVTWVGTTGAGSQWLPRSRSSGSSTRMFTVRGWAVSPPARGEGDGGGSALDDGVGVGGNRYERAAAGRVVDLDFKAIGASLGVAAYAVDLADALDVRYQLVGGWLFDPVHVGIDGEVGGLPPGRYGHLVVLGAGVVPLADLAIGLAGLDPDGDRPCSSGPPAGSG